MRAEASGSGQRTRLASICASVTRSASTFESRLWTRPTQASTSMFATAARSFRPMAPAATRPIVSRALARPPPCQLRTPYFASVV